MRRGGWEDCSEEEVLPRSAPGFECEVCLEEKGRMGVLGREGPVSNYGKVGMEGTQGCGGLV